MLLGLVLVALLLGAFVYTLHYGKVSIEEFSSIDRPANIRPDYTDVVIPANIAPLNFVVQEDGLYYCARIYSKKGKQIEVLSKTPKIVIPQKSWHRLLDANRGQELHFDVFVKTKNNQWNRFGTITNRIASEDIDAFVVYRKMHPTFIHYHGRMGIYQRNLENFDESLVLDDGYLGISGCLNCHTFSGNRPNKMLIGIRSFEYGTSTIFVESDAVNKIEAKFGYAAWHPSGKMAVFSIINLPMFFHSARGEIRDTVDLNSSLAYYLVDAKGIRISPKFAQKERLETWPVWSADGRYLYFCSAPILWSSQTTIPPDRYKEVKYDLVRIGYDIESDEWGQLETVISSDKAGKSIGAPRTSPDGRWLSFCMFDYGYFPTWQKSSDLFLVDIEEAQRTGRYEYRRLEVNSDQSESWHSWSSNSRWIIFSSKRDYGDFTRLYIAYIDRSGKAYKPLLLPQKDPTYYDSCLLTYNTAELVIGPVPFTGEKLAKVVRSPAQIFVDMPISMATPTQKPEQPLDQYLGERE